MKILRFFFRLFTLIVAMALVAAIGAYLYIFKSNFNAVQYDGEKLITIHRGYGFRQIAQELKKQGVIKQIRPLLIAGELMKTESLNIKPGRYYIPSGMTNPELLRFMYSRKETVVRVTILEGTRGSQIAGVIAASLDIDSTEFMQAFTDTTLLRELQIPAPNFEGYLMPDTYDIIWSSTGRDVIKLFAKEFRKFFNNQMRTRAAELGLSENEAITLASIIEDETPVPSERPLIASVYLNRLKKGMKLQADPTVQYALGGGYRRLFYSDLKIDSPYNTYMYAGLPPGPIGNPSRSSLKSALYPEKSPYLYFVATGNGGHFFARTGEEHLRNVAKYQSIMRVKRAEQKAESSVAAKP
jgi:UPF0755 protein